MAQDVSSAQLIIAEAERRGIEAKSFADIQNGFALLVLGDHKEYIFQSQSNRLGRVAARMINDNKVLATHLLRSAGFPVPDDKVIENISEAQTYLEKYGRIVIKPLGNDGGKGVTPNITSSEGLSEAMEEAASFSTGTHIRYVCQEHVVGRDYRVLVVNGDDIFASERIPAQVIGDGVSTMTELIKQRNEAARQGFGIKDTKAAQALLAEKGYDMNSVVSKGEKVVLALVANAHAGGTVRDATAEVSEDVKNMARQVAATFQLPVVGVDILSEDISYDTGKIIELNPAPDITIHAFPDIGEPRYVAPNIVDMLFPETVGEKL